jgi:hypothetical protein
MATFKEKRNKIENLVLGVLKKMDNSKMANHNRYEKMFELMTDKEFEKWAEGMGHELDDTIQLFQLPFEEVKMPQIKAAADFLKMPLEEYIWYRHNDADGIRTKMRVPVGYVHIKRVQQLLAKKNRYAYDVEDTELKSGQVKDDSKVASISDPETFFLTVLNADKALEEFLGPRSDNQSKKNEMYRQISRDGYTTLEGMEKDITQSTTLNTLNTYLLASGIRSDLVVNSLKTTYTVDQELRKK